MPKKIEAKIIADSINKSGTRITTYVLTYPRFIHAELMTHRVFSRNSASSRAIPFEKMLKMVEEDPFIPIAWQKDHKGMQGTEYLTEQYQINYRIGQWLNAAKLAKESAISLSSNMVQHFNPVDHIVLEETGVTKQLCNRLFEPFMWHTVIVTATEYDNFFELRCPKYELFSENMPLIFKSKKDLLRYVKDVEAEEFKYEYDNLSIIDWLLLSKSGAEIHIQALAEAMWDAQNESRPKLLKGGEWHIPFGDQMNLPPTIPIDKGYTLEEGLQIMKAKIAVARCARLSYMTFDGEINYEKDIALYNQLLQSKHLSPFEHVALCPEEFTTYGIYKPDDGYTHLDFEGDYWSGNFKHWVQYRQLIDE